MEQKLVLSLQTARAKNAIHKPSDFTTVFDKADKTGVDINISKKQISAQSKNGGFLGAVASFLARTVLPTVAKK